MAVHGVYSSYLGDYEFDIGKTIAWHRWFTDKDYIVDANISADSRNWVVAWDKTVPEGQYSFMPYSFFTDPARWRRESFERAALAWNFSDDDWVFFLDGHESLCFNTAAQPVEQGFSPWMDMQTDPSGIVWGRHWAFLNQGPVNYTLEVVDPALQATIAAEFPTATPARKIELSQLSEANRYSVRYAVPRYVELGWLPRLFQVGYLRSGIDWSILDTPLIAAPSGAATLTGLNIVSYAYSRWAIDPTDLDPDTLQPLSEGVDVGWATRQLISEVHPISSLGTTDWATPDPAGQTGPSPDGPGDLPGMSTPVYGSVFRSNLRDGVYYYRTNPLNATQSSGDLGPVPWDFLNSRPAVSPATWANQ